MHNKILHNNQECFNIFVRYENSFNLMILIEEVSSLLMLLKQLQNDTALMWFNSVLTRAYCFSSVSNFYINLVFTYIFFQLLLVGVLIRIGFISNLGIAVLKYFWIKKNDRTKDKVIIILLFASIFITTITEKAFSILNSIEYYKCQ